MLKLADLTTESGSESLIAALVNVGSCAGLSSQLLAGVIPDSKSAIENFVTGAVRCLIEVSANPVAAAGMAEKIVSLETGAPLSVVQSDLAFKAKVDRWTGKLNLAGKALKTVELAQLAFVVWQSVGELLGRESGAEDPATVTLHLTAPVTLCGVAQCHQVATADVDGDGRPDQIGLALASTTGQAPYQQQVWTLRVLTATGKLAIHRHGPEMLYGGDVYFGNLPFDGQSGNEIVLRITPGAHTPWYWIYTWRNGKLVRENDPDTPTDYQGGGWAVDQALSGVAGITCGNDHGQTTVTQTIITPSQAPTIAPRQFTGTAKTWAWINGAWKLTTIKNITVWDDAAGFNSIGGWHCSGLPNR
jgi:hypothetical protein